CGLACANAVRVGAFAVLLLSVALLGVRGRLALALALAIAGWWWGSARLDRLDHSVLATRVGEAGRAQVVITAPPRRGRFEVRSPGVVTRFAGMPLHEPVLLELPNGRAPPQGAILAVLTLVKRPRGPSHGFDERTWLRRHGVHVVLRIDEWRVVGHRDGIGRVADLLRRRLQRTIARGLHGERASVVEGVVLGDDSGPSDD